MIPEPLDYERKTPRPRPHVVDWGLWGAMGYAAILFAGVLFCLFVGLLLRLIDS